MKSSIRMLALSVVCLHMLAAIAHAGSASPEVVEICRLRGEALKTAVFGMIEPQNLLRLTAEDLTCLASRLQEDQKSSSDATSHSYAYHVIFSAACLAAGDEQVDALSALYVDRMGADRYSSMQDISPLALAWARRELRAIQKERRQPLSCDGKAPPAVPEELHSAPRPLIDAWIASDQASARYRVNFSVRAGQKRIAAQDHWREFYAAIRQVLLEPKIDGAAEWLSQFGWGGMCGTGMEQLDAPQSCVRVLALLRERRLEEAAGAALANLPTGGICAGALAQEVLAGLGLDWETLLTGAYLVGFHQGLHNVYSQQALVRLAVAGSTKGSELLLSLADFAYGHERERRWFIEPLALLITPAASAPTEDQSPWSEMVEPRKREKGAAAVSEAMQQQALALLNRSPGQQDDHHEIDTLLKALARLRRPETASALRRIAAGPADGKAETALEVLRSMGEATAPRSKTGPMQFRILVNGAPLAGRMVQFDAKLGENGSLSSSGVTTAEGVLGIEDDDLQAPAHPAAEFALMVEDPEPTVDGPAAIVPSLWLQTFVPPPSKPGDPAIVRVVTTSLILHVKTAGGVQVGSGGKVQIERNRTAILERRYLSPSASSFQLPPNGELTLPGITPGEYQIVIDVPGRKQWSSGSITAGFGPCSVSAELR